MQDVFPQQYVSGCKLRAILAVFPSAVLLTVEVPKSGRPVNSWMNMRWYVGGIRIHQTLSRCIVYISQYLHIIHTLLLCFQHPNCSVATSHPIPNNLWNLQSPTLCRCHLLMKTALANSRRTREATQSPGTVLSHPCWSWKFQTRSCYLFQMHVSYASMLSNMSNLRGANIAERRCNCLGCLMVLLFE